MEETNKLLVAPAPTVRDIIDHTILEDYHLAILGTETSNTVTVMITDPSDLPLLVDFVETNIGPATEALKGTIAERGGAQDRRMEEVGDTGALAQRDTKATQICQSQEELRGTCQMFKLSSWKMWTGKAHPRYVHTNINIFDKFRDFVYHIENAFRDRGLRTDVLMLSPRILLSAVIRRQTIEGVLAIVKVSRPHQYSGKIPLQVFDRSNGVDHVPFKGMAVDCAHWKVILNRHY
jgi:hypothetical protein